MRHTLIAHVQNEPLVLGRVVGLLTRRGFAIAGITVGPSEAPGVSRLTIVVEADRIEQVVQQLLRLVPVLSVIDASPHSTVERETALVRMDAPPEASTGIIALCSAFQARVISVGDGSLMAELTAGPEQVEQFLEMAAAYGIQELARSGRIAMLRQAPGRRADAALDGTLRRGWQPVPEHATVPAHSPLA